MKLRAAENAITDSETVSTILNEHVMENMADVLELVLQGIK